MCDMYFNIKIVLSSDIDAVPLEGINQMREPPPPPPMEKDLAKNLSNHQGTSFTKPETFRMSPNPRSGSQGASTDPWLIIGDKPSLKTDNSSKASRGKVSADRELQFLQGK